MMDLTASDHDPRCDRIRDLIVGQQPAMVGRAIDILQAEHSALTGMTSCLTKSRWSQSDRHHTVTADDEGFGSYPLKPGTSMARSNKPGTYLFHHESHRGSRGEVIVT
jgi:hypothetical protein